MFPIYYFRDISVRQSHFPYPVQMALYLIIAGALVGTVLILVVCCSVASCTQKRRARKAFSSSNVAIHEKYCDTARSISTNRLVASASGSHYGASDQQIAVGGAV